jgi:hypothetical protein
VTRRPPCKDGTSGDDNHDLPSWEDGVGTCDVPYGLSNDCDRSGGLAATDVTELVKEVPTAWPLITRRA